MCACLLGAGDLAGLQAARADVGLTDMALGILDGDLLDIGTKDPVGHAMGVTDVAARRRVLSADFAYLRHIASPCCKRPMPCFHTYMAYRHANSEL